MKNHIILLGIQEIIKEKKLQVIFIKVKDHSDDFYNDIANTLAKDAFSDAIMNKNSIIKLDNLDCCEDFLEYRIQWQNLDIDTRIRSFIKHLENDKISIDWALNSDIRKFYYDKNNFN